MIIKLNHQVHWVITHAISEIRVKAYEKRADVVDSWLFIEDLWVVDLEIDWFDHGWKDGCLLQDDIVVIGNIRIFDGVVMVQF